MKSLLVGEICSPLGAESQYQKGSPDQGVGQIENGEKSDDWHWGPVKFQPLDILPKAGHNSQHFPHWQPGLGKTTFWWIAIWWNWNSVIHISMKMDVTLRLPFEKLVSQVGYLTAVSIITYTTSKFKMLSPNSEFDTFEPQNGDFCYFRIVRFLLQTDLIDLSSLAG